MRDYLIFAFSPNGCTIRIEHNGKREVVGKLSDYSCLQLKQFFGLIHPNTQVYFSLQEPEKTPIPPGILKAFEEEELL